MELAEWVHSGEGIDAPLIVVTVEALLSVVRQKLFNPGTEKGHLLGFVDLVVLDKFQTLGDEAIGPMWEELLLLVGHQVCPPFPYNVVGMVFILTVAV